MDAINQRIALFIDQVNMNPNRFAKEVGYKRPDNIYNVYTGRTKPSWEMLEAIAARFTDLNMNWLIRGSGTMMKAKTNEEADEQINTEGVQTDGLTGKQRAEADSRRAVVTVDKMGRDTILAVPLQAQQGYRDKYKDTDYLSSLSSFVVPYFTEGNYRAFQMDGDSMEPTVRHGDYVIGSYLHNPKYLKPGNAYAIVTTDGIILRRVAGGVKEQKVELVADSPYYPSCEQPLEDIKEIWLIKGVPTTHVSASRLTGQDQLLPVIEALGRNTLVTQKLLTALQKQPQA